MSSDSDDSSNTKNSIKVSELKQKFNNMSANESDNEKIKTSPPKINKVKLKETFLKLVDEKNFSKSNSNDNTVEFNELKVSIKNDDDLLKPNYDIKLVHSNDKETTDSSECTDDAIIVTTEEQNINNNSQDSTKQETVLIDSSNNQGSLKESDNTYIENAKETSSLVLNDEETSSNFKVDLIEEQSDRFSTLLNSNNNFQQSIIDKYHEDSGEETWLKKGCKKLMTFLKATDDQNRNLILRGIELFGDSFVSILLWKSDNDRNFWINMAQNHISSFSQLTSELKLDLEIIINEIQEANRLNRVN
jgi:hypothetical protein